MSNNFNSSANMKIDELLTNNTTTTTNNNNSINDETYENDHMETSIIESNVNNVQFTSNLTALFNCKLNEINGEDIIHKNGGESFDSHHNNIEKHLNSLNNQSNGKISFNNTSNDDENNDLNISQLINSVTNDNLKEKIEKPPPSSNHFELSSSPAATKLIETSKYKQDNENIENSIKNTAKTNSIPIPFPFLIGEKLVHSENTDDYYICLTNYRICVKIYKTSEEECHLNHQDEQLFCSPINNIDSVEIRDLYFLTIYTKYIESFVITFQNTETANLWLKRLSDIQDVGIEQLFCFRFFEEINNNVDKNLNDNKINELILINENVIKMYQDKCPIINDEFNRMKFDVNNWRLCQLNKEFKLCTSYPQYFIVPKEMDDRDVESVANFRYSRRIPVVVWRSKRNGCVILRSSQPVVGWFGGRNSQDEKMLQKILKICTLDTQNYHSKNVEPNSTQNNETMTNGVVANHNVQIEKASLTSANGQLNGNVMNGGCDTPIANVNHCHNSTTSNHNNNNNNNGNNNEDNSDEENKTNKLLILDARSYTAAFANRAMGGGCECPEYYTSCDVQFMSLNNIHSIRKSFYNLRYICESSQIDQSNWLVLLDNTKWLHNLASLLKAAVVVVDAISIEERPVLVHCSDGWDRTPQVIALAELMLDPYYRTLNGFKVLIEKEWLQFGHKFADRGRSSTLNIDPNERCPVFLQWVDCVHQLLKQFPYEFEFNDFYLMKLVYHSYSCLFGTFTCNTVQERMERHVYEKTISLWSYFELNKNSFINYLYLPKQEILRPSCRIKDINFWNEIYVPVSNNNSVTNMISCNRICNSNVNNNRTNEHQSIIFNEGNNLNESKIEFNCNHDCASQSKFDLNRFASCESLYECDSKQITTSIPKIINNNLIRIRSDSCMLLKKSQIEHFDKFSHQYEYKINGGDIFNQTIDCSKPFKDLDLQDKVNQQNLEPEMTISCKNSNNYNNNHHQNHKNHHHHHHYHYHHQNAMKNGHQINKSCKEDACSTDSLTLFDIDGQMIGKNNSQMQLEQLINYHKKMIRCLSYQLKLKKSN